MSNWPRHVPCDSSGTPLTGARSIVVLEAQSFGNGKVLFENTTEGTVARVHAFIICYPSGSNGTAEAHFQRGNTKVRIDVYSNANTGRMLVELPLHLSYGDKIVADVSKSSGGATTWDGMVIFEA